MGEYTLVTDVGSTLVRLFQKNMVPELISKPEMIGLCSPNEPGDFALTVYLYHMEENGDDRKNDMIAESSGRLRYPPITLTLHYLVTAHSKAALGSRCMDENLIMGKVVQLMYDNPLLEPGQFDNAAVNAGETLRIELDKLSSDELRRIWSFPNSPYKLSLSFSAKPVHIDSKRVREVRRVTDAEFTLRKK